METLSQARLKKQWPVKIFSESRLLFGNKGQKMFYAKKEKNFTFFLSIFQLLQYVIFGLPKIFVLCFFDF